jgi:hypothetical protein
VILLKRADPLNSTLTASTEIIVQKIGAKILFIFKGLRRNPALTELRTREFLWSILGGSVRNGTCYKT